MPAWGETAMGGARARHAGGEGGTQALPAALLQALAEPRPALPEAPAGGVGRQTLGRSLNTATACTS